MPKKKTKNIDQNYFSKISASTKRFATEDPKPTRERTPYYTGKHTGLGLFVWVYQMLSRNETSSFQNKLTDSQLREALYKEFSNYPEKIIAWKKDKHKAFRQAILVWRNKFNRAVLQTDRRYPENLSFAYGPDGRIVHHKKETPQDRILELCIKSTIYAVFDSKLQNEEEFIEASEVNPSLYALRKWMIFQRDIKELQGIKKVKINQGGMIVEVNYDYLRKLNPSVLKKMGNMSRPKK